jgi:NAD-dependent SIR2 family protein deacetylase
MLNSESQVEDTTEIHVSSQKCECTSCDHHIDDECHEPVAAKIPDLDDHLVCAGCATEMEAEGDFEVVYFGSGHLS